MASSDPKQGGDLFDMAKDGTSIPNDAGKMNILPSVPRPDQITDPVADPNNLGSVDVEGAADNATDISRIENQLIIEYHIQTNKDSAIGGEVITGTGDQLPAQVESKRLHFGANDPLSKGHDRYDKHTRQKGSDQELYASEGAGMDDVPGQEGQERDGRERNETAQ